MLPKGLIVYTEDKYGQRTESVSYTHLDVYKRQAELRSRAEIQYEGYSKALNIEARAMIDIASKHIIPVSYTHLDVYKRQSSHRSAAIP